MRSRIFRKKVVALCLSLVAFGTIAWATDTGRLFDKIAILQSAINENSTRYSSADLVRIEEHINAAIQVARNPQGGGEGSISACQQSAYNYGLRGSQLSEICRNANAHTVACIESSYNYGLRGDDIVFSCSARPHSSVRECHQTAYNYGLRGRDIANVCRQNNEYVGQCFSSGYNYGLRGQQLVQLCSRPRRDVSECLASSYNFGLRGDELVNACN